MPTSLVIVESPAKAKTIAGYLGDDFVVDSSVGHIRDLAVKKELPESYHQEDWAEYGVNIYDGFKPFYVVNPDKKSKVRELKALIREVDELYLATDEDREGEAIASHLLEVLNPPPGMPVRRMVFHEITPQAIAAALENPRDINHRLVDAQETRRILDRLFGWDVTKVVRRVTGGASAGRVQSVAVRIVVERERARMAFVSADYWTVSAQLARADGDTRSFSANVVSLDGTKVAVGKDFDDTGATKTAVTVLDESSATRLADELRQASVSVRSVERRPYRQRPSAPFTTSTLQQEAGRKLRFSAQRAMRAAQGLYERGFITYMRTDSTTLSSAAISAARAEIAERFGAQYRPDAPRTYTKKSKNAQEAHEAIRPAGDSFAPPDVVARNGEVNADMGALYRLIWQRTVASQMTDATGETVTVKFTAPLTSWNAAELSTAGTVITHQGFRLAYIEDVDDDDDADDDERQLPAMSEGDAVGVQDVTPDGHRTKPPARYTEASLVKKLEELGVGRPSTYASTIGTILDRGYVWKKGTALVPSWRAFAVTRFMEEHFGELVDYQFTAHLEDRLDDITLGDRDMLGELTGFYWGDDGAVPPGSSAHGGLRGLVDEFDTNDIRPVIQTVNPVHIGDDPDGKPINVWPGKTGGPYLKRGDDTASVPEDLPPDELTVAKALELLSIPREGRHLGDDPATGKPVYAKAGRFGPYVQLGEFPDDKKAPKPRTSSLFATMTVERITLDEALELLTLPREVGVDPDDGGTITAANGKFGPYLQKLLADETKDSRSLGNEEQLLTVTLDEAQALFAQPKRRRGQSAPKPPMATFGEDPESGAPIVMKEGRFGVYVTDGETNASLRTGDDPETIGRERVLELLAERRAKIAADGGPKKKATKKKPAKKKATKKKASKAAPKKSAAKKATKKAANKAAAEPPSSADSADSDEPF